MKNSNRSNLIYVLVALCIAVVLSCAYAAIVVLDTRRDAAEFLGEISRENVRNISQRLHYDHMVLTSISETLEFSNLEPGTVNMREFLKRKKEMFGFSDIVVVEKNGEATSSNETKLPNFKNRRYVRMAMEGKHVLYHGKNPFNDDDHIVRIAMPYKKNGATVGVLLGVYMKDALKNMLASNAFGGNADAMIIGSDGALVAINHMNMDVQTEENYFALSRTDVDKDEYERYNEELKQAKTAVITYSLDNQKYIKVTTPIEMKCFADGYAPIWFYSMEIPYDYVAAKSKQRIFKSTGYGFVLVLVLGLLCLGLFRKNMHQRSALQKSYDEMHSLYRTIPAPIIRFRLEDGGIVLSNNDSFSALVGSVDEVINNRFELFTTPEFIDKIWGMPDGYHNLEILIRCYGKRYLWHLASLEISTTEEGREALCVLVDISEQREKINTITKASVTDALTGLTNRRGIQEQLKPLFADESLQGALLIMDLDNFKQVNDIFGHKEGDGVLAGFAAMLRRLLPKNSFISRYGGDEFVVFLQDISRKDTCRLAGQIKEQMPKQFSKYVAACNFDVSFGSVFVPDDGRDWDSLFMKVDDLLYENKRQNKMNYHSKGCRIE